MTAADTKVSDTLALLDGPFASVAKSVAEDRYAFWLGSGISFGRVEGLRQIIPRVIEFLRGRVVRTDPACPYRSALEQAVGLASPSAEERGRIALDRPFTEWPDAEAF